MYPIVHLDDFLILMFGGNEKSDSEHSTDLCIKTQWGFAFHQEQLFMRTRTT